MIKSLSEPELPIDVEEYEITITSQSGRVFNQHIKFIKQKIHQALRNSYEFNKEQLCKAVGNRVGEYVNFIMFEEAKTFNMYDVYCDSHLEFSVEGICFYFFTP